MLSRQQPKDPTKLPDSSSDISSTILQKQSRYKECSEEGLVSKFSKDKYLEK